MAEITLWNSVAKRRRSISDTFYDNGLGTLKGYLEDKGYRVEIIDWAKDDFFPLLSPTFLTSGLRKIYSCIMDSKCVKLKRFLGMISMPIQEILSCIQEKRLKRLMGQLVAELKAKKVRIFGVKIWYGEAYRNAKYLVNLIRRKAPEIITIAGGYHATLYEEHLLENSDFDLAVVCEGEFALEQILRLADNHKDGFIKADFLNNVAELADANEIENLIYRKNGRIFKSRRRDISAQSLKSMPKYNLNENKVSVHVMVESLGCDWGKCNFCVHPHFYPNYSLRGTQQIVNEIEEMIKMGISVFRFAGSDTPPAFGARIARDIIDKKLNIIFGMGSRSIRGAKNAFEKLAGSYETLIQGGLRAVFMGGESGSDFINEAAMNKGIVSEDIIYTVKALREAEKRAGIKIYLSLAFIFPPPLLGKLTIEQVQKDNIQLLRETIPDSVMITPPGPFLHTKWYTEREKFGFTIKDDIIKRAMDYEYVLYKPPEFWPELGISLEGKPFKMLLDECNQFRTIIENELHIPTDISDEHFLMFYGAGIKSKEDIFKIKKGTMLDIISCDYRITRDISSKLNDFSKRTAIGNQRLPL